MLASLYLLPLWFVAACGLIRESGDVVGSLGEPSPSGLLRHQDIAAWPARLERPAEDVESLHSGLQGLQRKRTVQQRDQAQDSISNSERPPAGVDGLLDPYRQKRVRQAQDHSLNWPVFSKDDFWENLLTHPETHDQWAHLTPRVLDGDDFQLGALFDQLDAHEHLVSTSPPQGSPLGVWPPGVMNMESGSLYGHSPQLLQPSPGLVVTASADITGASSSRISPEVPSISSFASDELLHTSVESQVHGKTHAHAQGPLAAVHLPRVENNSPLHEVLTQVPSQTHLPQEVENPETSASPDRITNLNSIFPSFRQFYSNWEFSYLFNPGEPLSIWKQKLLDAFAKLTKPKSDPNNFFTIPDAQTLEDLESLQKDLVKQDGLPYSKRFFFGVAYDDVFTSGYRTGVPSETPLQQKINEYFSTNTEGFMYLERRKTDAFFKELRDNNKKFNFTPFKGKVKSGGGVTMRDGFAGTLARKLIGKEFWTIMNGYHPNQKWDEWIQTLENHGAQVPLYSQYWSAYQRKVMTVIQVRQVFLAYSTMLNKIIVDDNFESDKQQIFRRQREASDFFDNLWRDSQCGKYGDFLLNSESPSAGGLHSALNFGERKAAIAQVNVWLNSNKRAERLISIVMEILKLWLANHRHEIFRYRVTPNKNPIFLFLNRIMCYVFDVPNPTFVTD